MPITLRQNQGSECGAGAPEGIRTPDLCIRRTLDHSARLDYLRFLDA